MNDFLVGLQFLTRITLSKNVDWSEKACGGSVKFFPLIGAVLSIFYGIVGYIIFFLLPNYNVHLAPQLIGFILLALNIFLTGALHCDGFTDTMDGILSGRQPQRILEIMKDSRVGAHGATSLMLLLIGKYTMFASLSWQFALAALILMPIIPRHCMSIAVVLFPYARPQGLGKAFHEYSGKRDLILPAIFTILITLLCQPLALIVYVLTTFIMYAFDRYVCHLIGGLTGDVYGATTELGEFVVLFLFVITQYVYFSL